MADIICAKCGEPWDASGVRDASDMTRRESERFLKGEGCPCCKFGGACPTCDGSGRYSDYPYQCNMCLDRGYVAAWVPTMTIPPYKVGEFYVGFSPKVTHVNAERVYENRITLGVRKLPQRDGGHMSRDGYVEEWWIPCPLRCAEKPGISCPDCDGKGTLASPDEDLELAAAQSEIDASDEDPFDIIERRGLESL